MGLIQKNDVFIGKRGLIKVLVILLLTCSTEYLHAQESLMQEVSNEFLGKLIDTAKKYYPIVKVNQHKIAMASINMKKSQLGWFDFFSITLNYSPSGGASSLNQPTLSGFSIGMFINIASLLQKPLLIKTSKEEYEIAKLNKEEYDITFAQDVRVRYYKYVQFSILIRVQSKISLESESIVKEARYKYEKGEANFETFTKALIYESDMKKDLIEAEANYLIAKSGLESFVGKKLAEIQ
jgi:outer membrane protein TolC